MTKMKAKKRLEWVGGITTRNKELSQKEMGREVLFLTKKNGKRGK